MFFWYRFCMSRLLMISGIESGCLALQNQAFGAGSVAKPAFHICLDSADFSVILICFSADLELILMTFGAL